MSVQVLLRDTESVQGNGEVNLDSLRIGFNLSLFAPLVEKNKKKHQDTGEAGTAEDWNQDVFPFPAIGDPSCKPWGGCDATKRQ